MRGCAFCMPDENHQLATMMLMSPIADAHVRFAQFFFDDGITVILKTPDEPTDQRIHIDTNRCPMCGRVYKETTDA